MIADDINHFFVRVSFIGKDEGRKIFLCSGFQDNINVFIRKLFAQFCFYFQF